MLQKRRALLSLGLFLAIGAGVPLVERWIKCQQPTSEACVWAKAYLPLSLALWAVAGLIGAVAVWVLSRERPRK